MKSNARKPEERAPRHQERDTHNEAPRQKSKSVKRGGEEIVVENKLNAEGGDKPKQIFGLGGEMALAAATSKKAQQRIKKQLKQ